MGRKAVTQNNWRGYHPEGVYCTEFCFQMTYILFRLTQPFLTALWARHKWDVLFHLDTLSVKYTELKCTKSKRVKFCLSVSWRLIGRVEIRFHSFLTSALVGGEWLPVRLTAGKVSRYPLNRRLGGPQSQSVHFEGKNYLPLPWFEPRTLKPIASRSTDYATPATQCSRTIRVCK